MTYKVELSNQAIKDFKKLDKRIAIELKKWIYNNLNETTNPRKNGKALTGNLKGLWRYRVGNYRIVVEIKDKVLVIVVVKLAHRKEVYK